MRCRWSRQGQRRDRREYQRAVQITLAGLHCLSELHVQAHQVGCNNSVEALRLQHHTSRHGINQHLIHRHVGEVDGHRGSNLIPQNQSVALSIALGHNSQELSGPLLGCLESEPDKPFDAVAGKDGYFGGNLPGLADVRATAMTSIFAFAVLADNDPVEVASLAVAKRRLSALENSSWSNIGVLLERLADGET